MDLTRPNELYWTGWTEQNQIGTKWTELDRIEPKQTEWTKIRPKCSTLGLILVHSVHFSSVQSNSVHFCLFGLFRSNPVLFSLFGPIRSVWSILIYSVLLVDFGLFSPLRSVWSISVCSVHFGSVRSTSVHLVMFGQFQCTYLRMEKNRFELRVPIFNLNLIKNIDDKR